MIASSSSVVDLSSIVVKACPSVWDDMHHLTSSSPSSSSLSLPHSVVVVFFDDGGRARLVGVLPLPLSEQGAHC